MSFLQSSKQKPSIYAHTELLHPAGQIPPVSWQQCALVDLTLLEVLKCFQVCWDQTHNVMFFLISNYPIVKTTWGFQNVSSHWPLLNKESPIFLQCGAFSQWLFLISWLRKYYSCLPWSSCYSPANVPDPTTPQLRWRDEKVDRRGRVSAFSAGNHREEPWLPHPLNSVL